MVSLYFHWCLQANEFVYGDFITLCFSPDGNEKPVKEKQIDFVAKKWRPKKPFFSLQNFCFSCGLVMYSWISFLRN